MIVGLCGHRGSGKNTVAEYLVDKYSFKMMSFAEPIKDSLSTIFNWDRQKLEGLSEEDRIWRETVDPYWSSIFGSCFTPRYAMLHFGTQIMRGWNEDIWVKSLENKLNTYPNIVVTDVRFLNEYSMLKSNSSSIIAVNRHNDLQYTHQADIEWTTFDVDYSVNNNSTIHDLHTQVDSVIFNLYNNQK